MRQVQSYVDERLAAFCYSCFGAPTTRDHVPPKVLLDEPFPENLPVVGACQTCNEGPSVDEEYFACLLEIAACGPAGRHLMRPKVRRILDERPALASRLEAAVNEDGYLRVEENRARRVIEKIARGLWSYETGETTGTMDAVVWFAPIDELTDDDVQSFLTVPTPSILPEVGSRLMFKVLDSLKAGQQPHVWENMQPQRFAYAIAPSAGSRGGVRMIIRDYLAVRVELQAKGEVW